jgi:hypothetical protein
MNKREEIADLLEGSAHNFPRGRELRAVAKYLRGPCKWTRRPKVEGYDPRNPFTYDTDCGLVEYRDQCVRDCPERRPCYCLRKIELTVGES